MNWLWLIPVLGFFILEFWGIHSENHGGKMRPLTYWIRRFFGLRGPLRQKVHSIGWWIALAICLWLVFHFAFERA